MSVKAFAEQGMSLRVGLLGASAGGSWGTVAHAPALQALDGLELVAVATTRQETADATARLLGVPRAYGDPFEMIRSAKIDAVAVAVRVPAHRAFVLAAIEAGKHVYCEWPLGVDTAEAETMLQAAGSAGVVHMVGLQSRQSPGLRFVQDLLAAGEIGPVHACLLSHSVPWFHAAGSDKAYLQDRSTGAHLLTIPGGHSLDAIQFTLGSLASVSALLTQAGEDRDPAWTSDDQVAVTATLRSGAIAVLRLAGGAGLGTGVRLEINGRKGDLVVTSVQGDRGIQMCDLRIQRTVAPGELRELAIPEEYFDLPTLRLAPATHLVRAYKEFAAAIAGGRAATPGFDEAVRLHRLLDAVETADRESRRLDLDQSALA